MNKYDFALAVLVMFLAVFFASCMAVLIVKPLFPRVNTPQPVASSPDAVSDQPVTWSKEETLIRGAADALFDVDASADYKRGWRECCEFLITRMEKPND